MEKISQNESIAIYAMDEPGEGGACHEYEVRPATQIDSDGGTGFGEGSDFAKIKFQKGPIDEVGVNGCQMEDIMDILIHRIDGFQSGDFPCQENGLALSYIEMAKQALERRTKERQSRGVEGKREV